MVTLGALAMAILPVAVPKLLDFLNEWGLRPGNRPVNIKAQAKDRSLEIEFDPRTASLEQVRALVADIQALLKQEGELDEEGRLQDGG